ncbi:hypothetical protein U3516DRAFT_153469 [Neocallimastix sp. 'constans']
MVKCSSFSELQDFVILLNKADNQSQPNDGILMTNGQSLYNDNLKVYKIKTRNTVDLRFNGRYFYDHDLFPFLDKSQLLYTSNIKVIEFSNTE